MVMPPLPGLMHFQAKINDTVQLYIEMGSDATLCAAPMRSGGNQWKSAMG